VIAAASLGAVARPAVHRDGPPPAHTGGFGEPTCHQCHFGAGLNETGGELSIGRIPGRIERGRTYDLVVSLRRPGMRRAGFQLAARFAEGPAAGSPAGVLASGDERTAVVRDSATGVPYAQHNRAGSALTQASGEASWTVRWSAPARAWSRVVFHVAGNATNDDDSPLGDFVYTTAVEVPLGR
jgi:hypothetical protein